MTTPLLRALFNEWLDFAGPFPPASLPLSTAVARYADYQQGPHAWFLHTLVIRLDDAEAACRIWESLDSGSLPPLRLATVVGSSWPELPQKLEALTLRLPICRIEAIEGRWDEQATGVWRDLSGGPWRVYVEVDRSQPLGGQLERIAAAGAAAKLRTGGVRPELIPPAEQVLEFLATCRRLELAYKLTAGLHHAFPGDYPLTYAPDSESARFFGFLPICVAGLILESAPGATDDARRCLDDADPSSFQLTPQSLQWHDYHWTPEMCRQWRTQRLHSVGSCSFDEPLADIQELQ